MNRCSTMYELTYNTIGSFANAIELFKFSDQSTSSELCNENEMNRKSITTSSSKIVGNKYYSYHILLANFDWSTGS